MTRRSNPSNGFFSMGVHTLSVPMSLFAENRRRLAKVLKESTAPKNSVVVLQGGSDHGICSGDSGDMPIVFRQESYFHWAFGVLEPDWFGAIDVDSGKSWLFIPRLPQNYAIFMGKVPIPTDTMERYQTDGVKFIDEMVDTLKNCGDGVTLLLLKGKNTDSDKETLTAHFEGISKFKTDDVLLHPIMAELRVIKTPAELDVLRYATKISSDAHKVVMRAIRPGMKEYQCESIFLNHVYFYGGCRHVCYSCIACSGESGSVLHYGHAGAPNDQPVCDGDMVLFDMGAEYYRFCSDVTVSYPVNGKFTQKQKGIYNAVLDARNAVIREARPGVCWKDMHLLANRVMLEGLQKVGIIRGSIDDMMAVNLAGRVFQPCGLGHFIGLDTHDVGGYLPGQPERPVGSGLRSLRTARHLKANMAITIEPGCYFIEHLMDEAYSNLELKNFIVKEEMEKYRDFGGVRIEDDVIIHPDHVEVMNDVPRTIEEIEAWMAGEGGEVESKMRFEKTLAQQ